MKAKTLVSLFSHCLLLLLTLILPLSVFGEDKIQPEAASISSRASSSLLLDACRMPDRLIAVGDRGHILISKDQGKSWTQSPAASRSMLTSISCQGEQAWAAGHDAVILHSSDAGLSWELQFFDPSREQPIFDLWFRNEKEGVAIGAYGLYLSTNDGGQTWKQKFVDEEEPHLFQIKKTMGGPLFMSGEFGALYRSPDLGDSWEKLSSPYEGSLFGILPLDKERLLTFGLRGNIFYSGDQGESWERIESGTEASLLDGTIISSDEVVLVGLSGTVLRSKRANIKFSDEALKDRTALSSVLGGNPLDLILFGEEGSIRMSLSRRGK